jgi:hypothetical protein
LNLLKGWSEPAATNAPVQDEVVQVILGMNQKHILFPLSRDFSTPFSVPKFSQPTYFPPFLLTSLTSFPAHSNLSRRRQSLRKVESSTLKECAEKKARTVLHLKCRSEEER